MIDLIKSLLNPKYRVLKGIQIGNRAVLLLCSYQIPPRDTKRLMEAYGYVDRTTQAMKISFKNQPGTYWKSNTYRRIYTFKQLLRWRRLLPRTGSVVLEKKGLKWRKIGN